MIQNHPDPEIPLAVHVDTVGANADVSPIQNRSIDRFDSVTPPLVPQQLPNSHFDKLPVELIHRIITIGADDNPTPLYMFSSRIPEAPTSILNPFAEVASSVCQKWCTIVHSRSSAHLWCIKAEITDKEPDYAMQSARLKHTLSTSRGRSILALFNSPQQDMINWQYIHFFVAFMVLLIPYKSQLIYLSIPYYSYTPGLLTKFMDCPRLHTIEHNYSSRQSIIPADNVGLWPSESVEDTTGRPFLYGFDRGSTSHLLFPSLLASEMWLYGHRPSYDLFPIGPNLKLFSLHMTGAPPDEPLENFVVHLLTNCPHLESLCLDFDLPHRLDLSEQPRAQYHLDQASTKLRSLNIRGHDRVLLHLFRTFRFECLTDMTLDLFDSSRRPADEHSSIQEFSVPSLRNLTCKRLTKEGNIFLPKLTGFQLSTLDLDMMTLNLPRPISYSPIVLCIRNFDEEKETCIEMLHLLDLRMTTTINFYPTSVSKVLGRYIGGAMNARPTLNTFSAVLLATAEHNAPSLEVMKFDLDPHGLFGQARLYVKLSRQVNPEMDFVDLPVPTRTPYPSGPERLFSPPYGRSKFNKIEISFHSEDTPVLAYILPSYILPSYNIVEAAQQSRPWEVQLISDFLQGDGSQQSEWLLDVDTVVVEYPGKFVVESGDDPIDPYMFALRGTLEEAIEVRQRSNAQLTNVSIVDCDGSVLLIYGGSASI